MKIKLAFMSLTAVLATANGAENLTTSEALKALGDPNFVFVDARHDSFYNGFNEEGAKRGGHIPNAVAMTTLNLEFIEPSKFESYMAGKGIVKDKTLIIYDSNPDSLEQSAAEFESRGYKVKTYRDIVAYANDEKNPLESFKNFELSVSADWLNQAIKSREGKAQRPQSYDGREIMVFEVSWGPLEKSQTYKEHIKGAYHFDTDLIENGPMWNLSDPKVIEANLLKSGITKDKLVVVYSQNQLASLRVLWALKWAGVEDVRFLNGGMYGWMTANLPTETKVNEPKAETNFGVKIPSNPKITIETADEAFNRQKEGLKLISNRSWQEYLGEISGYDYIKGKGEPKGAIWGFAGIGSNDVSDYYDPDGTLRNPNEIFALWKERGIMPDDQLAFYCGTGWRASVPWFMTQLAGWKNSYVYDGGWNAWQMEPKLPLNPAPKDRKRPDSKNDFGVVVKPGASCKS